MARTYDEKPAAAGAYYGELPVGTVTFLFTDIEGSTRLLQEFGDTYADVLAEHRRVLRAAFLGHGGVEVDTQGDAFFFAFARASDALEAADEATCALDGGPVRVRMGIHTGEPVVTDEGYVGVDVHRAARVAAAAHGGQIVLSKETRDAIAESVPLLDLGEHRVKDFREPVWLFQLGNERFPPLKTISNTNLPRPVSSFVGRSREVHEVVSLLRDGARLVTLVGPGGSGKTRLAIESAAELVSEFRNGVFFVALASLREPDLVLVTVARTIGARDRLAEHIGERQLLLVLDNFEQVIDAAPNAAFLLETCPNLRVLVTSRELLRVRGEAEYAVLPLAESEAVALFSERSRLRPDQTVVELCRRLDSLPLALELAAARTSVLSPRQILARISQRLDLLQGMRDADARQQTLRATLEWSHELLSDEERRLFARLAVVAAGCTLDAAEQICGADVETLQSLVHKSLTRFSDERFWMLETIRTYALERLDESPEGEDIRERHADYYLTVAEEAVLHVEKLDEQARWFARLDAELENLRAALLWSRDQADSELVVRLATALREFWFIRGHYEEGLRWLDTAIERSSSDDRRLKALRAAADLASKGGDVASARRYADEGLFLARRDGDQAAVADLLRVLAAEARYRGDAEEHDAYLAEGLACAREAGELVLAGRFLTGAGMSAMERHELGEARLLLNEALAVSKDAGSETGFWRSLAALGTVALLEGKFEEALAAHRKVLQRAFEVGFREAMAYVLTGCAYSLAQLGETERAAKLVGAEWFLGDELRLRRERHHVEFSRATTALLRERLGSDSFIRLHSAGAGLSLNDVVELALAT